MRNRWFNTIAIALFCVLAVSTQAEVKLTGDDIKATNSMAYTFTDVSIRTDSTPAVGDRPKQTGFFVGGSGSFTVTYTGSYGWTNSAAMVATNDFGAFLNTLTNVLAVNKSDNWGVDSSAVSGEGVDSPNDKQRLNSHEVGIFTFDLSGLEGELYLNQALVFSPNNGRKMDAVIYSSASNTITDAVWDDGFSIFSTTNRIYDGDQLFLALVTEDSETRLDSLYLEVKSAASSTNIPPVIISTSMDNSKVELDWSDDPSPAVLDHYNLSRSLNATNGFGVITNTIDSSYVDLDVTNNVTYYYRATAVSTGSVETAYGNTVSETPIFPVPTGLTGIAGVHEAVLDWDDSTAYLFDHFAVYRSTTPGTNYVTVPTASNLSTNTFTDTEVIDNVTYYYLLKAVDSIGHESGYSTETSAMPYSDTAVFITASDNAYVRMGSKTNDVQDSSEEVEAKSEDQVSSSTSRTSFFRFDTSALLSTYSAVSLDLDIVDGAGIMLHVLALSDGADGGAGTTETTWTNSTLTGATRPDGVLGAPNTNTTALLGSYSAVVGGISIPLDPTVFANLLAADTNGEITFIVYGDSNSVQRVHISSTFNTDGFMKPTIRLIPSGVGYEGWAAGWGVSLGADTNDYDADGLSNIYEYGVDGNPTNALILGTLSSFTAVGDGFEYIHPQRWEDSNLVYTVQTTDDLIGGTWTNLGYTVDGTNVTGDTLNFVSNTVDTVENQKFIRLKIGTTE